jgi:hypothetical protein
MYNSVERGIPSNWVVFTNDGTNLTARNSKTSENFSGTVAEFNKIFTKPITKYGQPEWIVDGITNDLIGYKDSNGSVRSVVQNLSTPGGGVGITNILSLTQAQYDALVTKDPATLYVIVEG